MPSKVLLAVLACAHAVWGFCPVYDVMSDSADSPANGKYKFEDECVDALIYKTLDCTGNYETIKFLYAKRELIGGVCQALPVVYGPNVQGMVNLVAQKKGIPFQLPSSDKLGAEARLQHMFNPVGCQFQTYPCNVVYDLTLYPPVCSTGAPLVNCSTSDYQGSGCVTKSWIAHFEDMTYAYPVAGPDPPFSTCAVATQSTGAGRISARMRYHKNDGSGAASASTAAASAVLLALLSVIVASF